MTQTRPMLQIRRVSAQALKDYEVASNLTEIARDAVAEMKAAAEAEAAKVIADAKQEATHSKERAEAEAEERLNAIVEKHGAQVRDDFLLRIMKEVAAIRKSYVDAEEWMHELVVCCVERVIGTAPKGEAQAAAIKQGIENFGDRWTLHIRVAHADLPELHALQSAYPEAFEGVRGIHGHESVAHGSIHLYGDAGGVDVSITARLAALRDMLKGDQAP